MHPHAVASPRRVHPPRPKSWVFGLIRCHSTPVEDNRGRAQKIFRRYDRMQRAPKYSPNGRATTAVSRADLVQGKYQLAWRLRSAVRVRQWSTDLSLNQRVCRCESSSSFVSAVFEIWHRQGQQRTVVFWLGYCSKPATTPDPKYGRLRNHHTKALPLKPEKFQSEPPRGAEGRARQRATAASWASWLREKIWPPDPSATKNRSSLTAGCNTARRLSRPGEQMGAGGKPVLRYVLNGSSRPSSERVRR
jgi:hypothetical protein